MLINCDVVHMQGSNSENEDAYVSDTIKKIFAVIDGATGLGGFSGKTAAEIVKETINEINKDEPLIKNIIKANSRLGSKMGTDITTIPKDKRSTCGLAVVKVNEKIIEYVHAGDCMVFIQYKDNSIRSLTYDHLSNLDSLSIKLFKNKARKRLVENEDPNNWDKESIKKFLSDIREEILPKLKENRKKLNTIEGYGIIDGSNEAMNYWEYGSIPLQNIKRILLLSDGLQLPTHKGSGQEVWYETSRFAFNHGLMGLKDEVLRLESSDKACFKYPRLKQSDDKSGILITL